MEIFLRYSTQFFLLSKVEFIQQNLLRDQGYNHELLSCVAMELWPKGLLGVKGGLLFIQTSVLLQSLCLIFF